MVSEIIAGDVESRSIARIERELQALRGIIGDGVDKLHIDQESTSAIIENALLRFDDRDFELRSEIVPTIRIKNRLLIAVIMLQLLIAVLLLYVVVVMIGDSHVGSVSDQDDASHSEMLLFGQTS